MPGAAAENRAVHFEADVEPFPLIEFVEGGVEA
jgi:hypothetical protein